MVTIVVLGYCIRLFEQKAQPNSYKNYTTAMWNVLITMTTIGYGDYYPISHCGRVIAIITAFWGVLPPPPPVLACMNISEFSSQENKAFKLLVRLSLKDQLKL